ncbi:hypothetical protein [Halorientalis salina]|uniref:hypothetical protein n=1 Tax=Halorientalis salina TaxID=2932266 RepID=UPI0010AC12CB|nr:hypothetical protein [Halorientalis salina]
MNLASRSPLVAGAIIVLGTLVAAPGLGVVDIERSQQSTPDVGTGNVTVANASLPSTARFQQGSYGSGTYYLEVPETEVEFESVTGRPVLNYKLNVPALSYSRQSVYFVESGTERRTLTVERDTFPPETFSQTEYTGELVLTLRANGTERVLANRTVTVEVRE